MTGAGHDFGHDHGISSAERKKRQDKEFDAFIGRGKKTKKEEVEFAGNYEGPLYAPHPDLKEGGMQGAVDSITKRAQGALQSIGVKINNKPRPTARPSAQTANTMRQNSMSNEEAVSEGKKKKDDSYLETNMKKRHANNEKARKDMEKMGTKMKNPHFEEVEQVDENRAAMGRIAKEYKRKKEAEEMAKKAKDPKQKMAMPKRKDDNPMYDAKSAGSSRVKDFKFTKEALDPVGKEDGDVNNDGKKDSTDSYLMKRRKAIGKALASTKKAKVSEGVRDLDPEKELLSVRHVLRRSVA